MIEHNSDNIYFIGDTHELDFVDVLEHYKLKDFILIHVGDTGTGFSKFSVDQARVGFLQKYCNENNGQIFLIRGNHDDPKYFVENSPLSSSRVTFLPDYTYLKINGKVCLFVGGAISIDRQDRMLGEDYWQDEIFVLSENYNELPQCDVLVTHSSPLSCPPMDGLSRISGWFKNDPTLKEELIKERLDIEKLYLHVNCAQLYYGHFHMTSSYYDHGCFHRCLDINEIVDVTRNFSNN